MVIKHFLDIDDFSKDELVSFVDLAKLLKAGQKSLGVNSGFPPNLVMIFDKPSTRTRVSF